MVVTGTLNPDLQNPLPNATYTVDGKFHYTTDEYARTVRVEVDHMYRIPKNHRVREGDTQSAAGHIGDSVDPDVTWNGGHLAGTQFGGIPENINLVPMPDHVNQNRIGHQDNSYLLWERKVAKGSGYTQVVITVKYPEVPAGTYSLSNAQRVPQEFTFEGIDPDGAAASRPFKNYPTD